MLSSEFRELFIYLNFIHHSRYSSWLFILPYANYAQTHAATWYVWRIFSTNWWKFVMIRLDDIHKLALMLELLCIGNALYRLYRHHRHTIRRAELYHKANRNIFGFSYMSVFVLCGDTKFINTAECRWLVRVYSTVTQCIVVSTVSKST